MKSKTILCLLEEVQGFSDADMASLPSSPSLCCQQGLAQQKGLQVIETSTKDSTNIEAAFNKLAADILQKVGAQ